MKTYRLNRMFNSFVSEQYITAESHIQVERKIEESVHYSSGSIRIQWDERTCFVFRNGLLFNMFWYEEIIE